MSRTQLNISIDPGLYRELKKSAQMAGKTLSGFVSEGLLAQVGRASPDAIESRVKLIEERIKLLELSVELLRQRALKE